MKILEKFGFGGKKADRTKPIDIKSQIAVWEDEACLRRDHIINTIFGRRYLGDIGGMQGLVKVAHNFYTPRNWENPPYNKTALDITADNIVYPYYFSNVQSILPAVIPGKIDLTAIPLAEDKKVFSAMASAILDEEQEHLCFLEKIVDTVIGALNNGSQIVYFGHSARRGTFNIDRTMEVCDPLSVLVDPYAKSLDDAKFIIYKRWRLIDDVVSEYDLTGDDIPEPKVIDARFSTIVTMSGGEMQTESAQRCVETIIYLRDTSVKHVPETVLIQGPQLDEFGNPVFDEMGNEVLAEPIEQNVLNDDGSRRMMKVARYPHGRTIICINDNIVWDGQNPYEHKKCPFVKLNNHSLPGYFWAMPEWYVLGDIPQVVNEGVSSLQRNMRKSVIKTAFYEDAIDGDVEDITNDPSRFIRLKSGAQNGKIYETIPIGGFNPQNIQSVDMAMNIGEKVSGVTDASRGVSNPEVTSGKQQQILSEKALNRRAIFAGQFESFLAQCAERMLVNAVQFRNPQDVVEITTNVTEIQQVSIDKFPRDVEFKCKMVAASSLPSDRQERLKILDQMADKVIAYYNTVGYEATKVYVDATDTPEIEEFLEAIHSRAQQMQKMQMQQPMQLDPTQLGQPQPMIQ